MNLNSNEYIYKYGSMVQFGVSYMSGFSTFADEFLTNFNLYLPQVIESGYSEEWRTWQKNNISAICNLYDELNVAGLIPTNPIT